MIVADGDLESIEEGFSNGGAGTNGGTSKLFLGKIQVFYSSKLEDSVDNCLVLV